MKTVNWVPGPSPAPGLGRFRRALNYKHLAYSLLFAFSFLTILFVHARRGTSGFVVHVEIRQSQRLSVGGDFMLDAAGGGPPDNASRGSAASAPPKPSTLFIGIISSPANIEKRDAIRDTLGTHPLVLSKEISLKVSREEGGGGGRVPLPKVRVPSPTPPPNHACL